MPDKKKTTKGSSKKNKKSFGKRLKTFGKKIKKWWKKRTKFQKGMIIFVAVLLIIAISFGIFLFTKLQKISGEDDFAGDDTIYEDIDFSDIDSITDADSLNELCKTWATNGGELMSQSYVKNILLLGVDSANKLSDSMILVSLNQKTKTITLVSFMRDCYTYIAPQNKQPRFNKLNAAYSSGGVTCLIDTIQNDFKIKIDDYASVDYDTFPKVIDALGGVDVNVTEKEANYLNNTWSNWSLTGNQVSYTSGVNHLDGERALMFCRIRKLDSDNGRTARQRRVITAIMTSFKSASLSTLNKTIDVVLPNVKTSMSKTEITSFASSTVSKGWLKYEIKQTQCPSSTTSKSGSTDSGKWIWIVDYEGAAYELQTLLYGTSNIELSADRVSALTLTAKTATTAVATTSPVTTEPTEDETTTDVTTDVEAEPVSEDTSATSDTTDTSDTDNPAGDIDDYDFVG